MVRHPQTCPPDYFREEYNSTPTVFLAGGITNCPDWQAVAAWELQPYAMVLNPRRPYFDTTDLSMTEAQITWEFRHLRLANCILFWFPPGSSPQPIALLELGVHMMLSPEKLIVGADPAYSRALDVHHQLRLHTGLTPHSSLEAAIHAAALRLATLPETQP